MRGLLLHRSPQFVLLRDLVDHFENASRTSNNHTPFTHYRFADANSLHLWKQDFDALVKKEISLEHAL